MAAAAAVPLTKARLLRLPRKLSSPAVTSLSSLSSLAAFAPFKMGLFQSRSSAAMPPRKLTVRAARTESERVSLGFRAPQFQLPEPLTGRLWSLEDFESHPALLIASLLIGRPKKQKNSHSKPFYFFKSEKFVIDRHNVAAYGDLRRLVRFTDSKLTIKKVMFICNHCPFVKHLKKDIVKLTNFYIKKGLAVVAVSSNSVATHPQDGPEFMAEEAKAYNYPFPYLYDESQDVAHDFGAVCTPEFYLFKKDGRRPFELVYHGQFDDSRPSNNVPVTGRDLSLAIDCVLSGQPVSLTQKPRDILKDSGMGERYASVIVDDWKHPLMRYVTRDDASFKLPKA